MPDTNFNYVKFLRGTPSAYNNLAQKEKDTLYFVLNPEDTVGRLYLGDVLIAGGANGDNVIQYLNDLQDVNTAGATSKMVLGYDEITSTWVPMDPALLVTLSSMTGATERLDGTTGLVPAPKAGENKYVLRGDGTWTPLTISDINELTKTLEDINSIIEEKVNTSELESAINSINLIVADKANKSDVYTKQETDTVIASAVAQSSHLARKIVNSVEDINLYAEQNSDADKYIFMVPSQLKDPNNNYYEYIVIYENDTFIIEKIGEWKVSLEDYVTIEALKKSLDTKVDKVYFTVPVLDENGDPVYEEDGITPKTEQVEGTLLSPTDRKKLDALVITDTGIEISGTINAANVQGLGVWITQNRNSIDGLLSTSIEEKINSFDTTITGLEELLNSTNNKVVDIEAALDDYLLKTEYEAKMADIDVDINLLKQASIWKNINE